jgi:FkbM family methyltransferase
MKRRTFLPWFAGGMSGSFLLGAVGGTSVGAAGAYGVARSRPWCKESHAQQGEDLIVDSIFEVLENPRPSYLDVGAADPVQGSNTYLFYRRGCRGVLVEPNLAFARRLEAERPGDAVVKAGIGVGGAKELDYYMFGDGGEIYLNTCSKQQADDVTARSGGRLRVEKVIKVPLVGINEVISKHLHGAPDFLSVDTEGLDFDILKSLDFDRFRPAVVCVETLVVGTTRVESQIPELLTSRGYDVRGGTFVNTIFVDRKRLG